MASNPNKPIKEYIEQARLIQKTDDNAKQQGLEWILVSNVRRELDDILDQLIAKDKNLSLISPKVERMIEEKNKARIDARNSIEMLKAYILNAYRPESKQILQNLGLDRRFPQSNKRSNEFLSAFLELYHQNDNGKFPIPVEIGKKAYDSSAVFIEKYMACEDIKKRKHVAVKERLDALNKLILVFKPIRVWLYAALPKGKRDECLNNYGFIPYSNKKSSPYGH